MNPSARPNSFIIGIVGAWIIVVTVVGHLSTWSSAELFLAGESRPFLGWLFLVLAQVILIGAVLGPLAWRSRQPEARTIYRTWAGALGMGALFTVLQLLPITESVWAAVGQITFCLVLWRAVRRRQPAGSGVLNVRLLALCVAPLLLLPWLRYGALGSLLDTAFSLAAAVSFGLFAAAFVERGLFAPLPNVGHGLLSFALAVTLMVLGLGFGVGGTQLLLLLALPLLCFALARWRALPDRVPMAVLIAAAAAGPLLLFDPDELSLTLGDALGGAFRAAVWSVALAGGIGLLLRLVASRVIDRRARLGVFAAATVLAALVYLVPGQPGLYGERLFVVMREQADLSAAPTIPDRVGRLQSVYSTLTAQAERTQAPLRTALDRWGIDYTPYYLVNAIEVEGGPLVRWYVARQPGVDRVLASPRLRPLPAPLSVTAGNTAAPTALQWNITSIGANRVWRDFNVTGQGIIIGQSDSGVEGTHPVLAAGYRGRDGNHVRNWFDPWGATPAPIDYGGHGTHTLGSALGRNGLGVAPGAEWIGCVNLQRNLANPALYLDCMQWMLAPHPQTGDSFHDGDPALAAHVLNNSWGCPSIEGCDPQVLAPATAALKAAGIFVVASAGNDGSACSTVSSPIAVYGDVFSVGAVNEAGNVADFSSRGPVTVDGSGRAKPDLVAPGEGVLSAYPNNSYDIASGTSMAGPHVAGVVALLWSAQPALVGDIERTTQILRDTARPYSGEREGCFGDATPNAAYGYGVVDAYAAVQRALGR